MILLLLSMLSTPAHAELCWSRPDRTIGREFIVTLGGAAAATWPLAAHAQQPRRIGVLLPFSDSDPEARSWIAAFEERLQSLGWGRGRSIRIEYRWAGVPVWTAWRVRAGSFDQRPL